MNFHDNIIAFNTIVRKEIVRFVRIWPQTLMPPVVTQTLYFVIFGKFIGSQIGSIQGITYMDFIVPGLVMMAVINNAYANVVSSFFSSKFQRNVEELMVSPTASWVILAGYVAGGTIRGICAGILVYIVSIFFAHPTIFNMGWVLLYVTLTAIVFSLGGFLNAIFAKKFDDVTIFPTFVLTPLTYLGGIFYSIYSLPPFWQNLSKLNPILYMIDGFRYGFFGLADVDMKISISLIFLLIVMMTAMNLWVLKKGYGLKN